MLRLVLAALFLPAYTLSAQTADQVSNAANAIAAPDLARHIGTLTHDSMARRDVQSSGFEQTARYVVDQFKQLGLQPGGPRGEWLQRYPLPARIDLPRSRIVFTAGDKKVTADFATAARLLSQTVPRRFGTAGVVVLAGRHTAASLGNVSIQNKVVLYVAADTADPRPFIDEFTQGTGLIVLSSDDSAAFAQKVRAALRSPTARFSSTWIMQVRPEAAAGLREILAAGGVDLARVRADTTPFARDLPGVHVSLDLQLDRPASDTATAPIVLGVLMGSDSVVRREYIVFVADMVARGAGAGRTDSLHDAATDDASDVAGLIALAKAFSEPGMRPRRSIAFVATGGNPGAHWGGEVFASAAEAAREYNHLFDTGALGVAQMALVDDEFTMQFDNDQLSKVPPIAQIVTAFVLDGIGRGAADSVVVNGMNDVELSTRLDWIAAGHPELRLTVVDDGTAATPAADDFAFVQHAIPTLYVRRRSRESEPGGASSADAADVEREARVLRLIMYTGHEIANAAARPGWTAEGRRRFLKSRKR